MSQVRRRGVKTNTPWRKMGPLQHAPVQLPPAPPPELDMDAITKALQKARAAAEVSA